MAFCASCGQPVADSARFCSQCGPAVLGPVGGAGMIRYGAAGDVLNTAARLESASEPGTVLVGAETHRLIAPLFDWGEPRELTLKGKRAPVVAYPARAPRPTRGRPRRRARAADRAGAGPRGRGWRARRGDAAGAAAGAHPRRRGRAVRALG